MSESWFERSGYQQFLGARCEQRSGEGSRIRIPFRDEIANPGGALHGGVMASAIVIASSVAAGEPPSPDLRGRSVDVSVDYLAAAINEDIVATATVLRRGKEITYNEVDVRNDAGKRIAVGLVTHRTASAAMDEAVRIQPKAQAAMAEPELLRGADMFVSFGFMAALGLQVVHAGGGEAVLAMSTRPSFTDGDGGIHEGALAALIDTTGALASWSLVGLNLRFKASTVGIHVNYFAPAAGNVIAWARTRQREDEIFINRVELSDERSGVVIADATVTYRIVVPSASRTA